MAIDRFTKISLIAVIILLLVFIVIFSDYVIKIEPKTTTTTMVTTRPTTTSVTPTTTVPGTTTSTTTVTFDCSNAGFKFVSGSYSKPRSQLTVTLENTKSVDLTMEYVYLTYPTGVVLREKISGLLEGLLLEGYNTRSFLISQVEDGFRSGQITTNCLDVTADFTYSDVT